MKIISATNRQGSRTREVSSIVQNIYQKLHQAVDVTALTEVPFDLLIQNPYSKNLPKEIKQMVDELTQASALIIVCPEYNSSFPGILKFFMDHWIYPDTFKQPMCFVGLGGRFGGYRAIAQLKQIMSNLGAFVYSQSVFLQNIHALLKGGQIQDSNIQQLLEQQAKGFLEFVSRLQPE